VPRTFNFKLYDYQERGVAYILRHKYVILSDAMGLGKSIQALAAVHKTDAAKVLIVCPAFLRPNWRNEVIKAFGSLDVDRFTITSYASLKKVKDKYDFVILDEAHAVKNVTAKRTIAIHNYIRSNKPRYLLLMTGTPIMNRVPEIYSLLKLVSYGNASKPLNMDYWGFSHTFSNAVEVRTPYGTATKFEGIRNVEALKSYLKGKYIRRTNDVVDLPSLVKKDFLANQKQLAEQKEILEELKDNLKPNLAYISSKKMVMAMAKVKLTIDYVKDMVEQGEQVVVFSDHVAPAEDIANAIDGAVCLTGKDSTDYRGKIVQDFQAGKVPVITATIKALGTGVTLTAARHLVFNDYPFVPADLEQAEKRIHRIGQERTCFIHYVLSNKLDEYILKVIQTKKNTIEKVI
jgi:SWI/SNF-related matrix-associated actin-dependent regulator 1 of chromatin subfamily A